MPVYALGGPQITERIYGTVSGSVLRVRFRANVRYVRVVSINKSYTHAHTRTHTCTATENTPHMLWI